MAEKINYHIYVTHVGYCARCEGNHEQVVFNRFKRAMLDSNGDKLEWWGICPVTNEPMIIGQPPPEVEMELT